MYSNRPFGTPSNKVLGTSQKLARTQFNRVKVKLDSLLTNDIGLVNSNIPFSELQRSLQLPKQNKLVEEYIQNNYDEYNLTDPMPQLSAKKGHKRYMSNYQSKKVRQVDLFHSAQLPEKQDSSRKDTYRTIKNQNNLKTQPDQEYHTSVSTKKKVITEGAQEESLKTKKIVIKLKSSKKNFGDNFTKSKEKKENYFTTEFSEGDSHFQDIELQESQCFASKKQSKERKKFIQEAEQKHQSSILQPVNEIFRYCIGCEAPVLQANIRYHQTICLKLKLMMSLEWKEVIDILDKRLISLQQKIARSYLISQQKQGSHKQMLNRLLTECRISRIKGCRSKQFERMKGHMSLNLQDYSDFLENLSKLSWFLKLKENIRKNIIV